MEILSKRGRHIDGTPDLDEELANQQMDMVDVYRVG